MYKVRFVNAADLPEGRDWMLVRQDQSVCHLFVRRDAVTAELIEEIVNSTAAISAPCLDLTG